MNLKEVFIDIKPWPTDSLLIKFLEMFKKPFCNNKLDFSVQVELPSF